MSDGKELDNFDDFTLFRDNLLWFEHNVKKILSDIAPFEVVAMINSDVFSRACAVITHPFFEKLDVKVQVYTICTFIYPIFKKNDSRKLIQLAPIIADMIPRILESNEISFIDKMTFYDVVFSLYWSSDDIYFSTAPFNVKVVNPYSEYLVFTRDSTVVRPPRHRDPNRPRVGFLLNYANFTRSNAVGKLMLSIIRDYHQSAPGHEIFVYPSALDSAYYQALSELATVRAEISSRTLVSDRDRILDDQLDYLITDGPTSSAFYFFESRCAPRQIYFDMGFPCWAVHNLDLFTNLAGTCGEWMGMDRRKFVSIDVGNIGLDPREFSSDVAPALITQARRQFPPHVTILGCLCRFIKVTPTYVRLVRRLLKNDKNMMLFVAGSGDVTIFAPLYSDPDIQGQIKISTEPVDLNIYSRVIDIMLDTFPLAGGLTATEILYAGKPVVSMYAQHTEKLFLHGRDRALIADDIYTYEALVNRLASDSKFYAECCEIARKLGKRAANSRENGREFMKILDALPM